ncbi:MAG TPA: pitrilysin family protein, partial [Candidatus Eisenbacteria bacterium]|nr:pitrilysin family protein [Candidatus Eisenbacteria bacterium]
MRSAAIGVWIRVGSRQEARAEAGMTHFLEHVVFKGTLQRDALAIALSIESVGGHLDAFTGREVTCFNARVLEEHLDLAVDVLSDLALHPRLDPVDVEKEKGVIIEEIRNYEDTPDDCVHDLYSDVVWQGHPLGNRILGTDESVRAFSNDAIAGYHARHYTAPNVLVSVAGRFDWDRIVSLVASKFADAPKGAPPRPAPVSTNGRGVVHHERDLSQQYLCVGGAGLPHEHPDRYTLVLLSTLLGGGMSSRLFQRVREQEGLAYSVYTYADSYSDAGIFCASMSLQPGHGRKAVRVTLEEFDKVAEHGVPPDELRSVKEQLKGNLLLGLESTTNQMTRLARSEIYSGRYVSVDELIASVDRVTEEDVKRIARSVL